MLAQKFFKIFPPPRYLNFPYAGLDISDDAVRCIEFSRYKHGLIIHKYGEKILPPGTIESGNIKNKDVLIENISALSKELGVHLVKVSLPEERMYLFKTEALSDDVDEIRQNIESKLEENVPLSATESLFFFDYIPGFSDDDKKMVSVSVATRDLVMSYLEVIESAGVTPLSFEVQAKAIARAVVPEDSKETIIIVNITDHSTGIYIVCDRTVCFTSTIPWGKRNISDQKNLISSTEGLRKELEKVNSYWAGQGRGVSISRIILTGKGALADGLVSHCSPDPRIPAEIGQIWVNAFSHDNYIPPISFEDSMDYAVAAGLAFPSDFESLLKL